ncbi:MAG: hypothetical protein A2104_05050 [Candidatus Melainabacteria bacterium GWF2_32_7]|nr:MAG: hypothetical protein A2104_05050 [Candidatus Melainabacteria bacterium GWF2_32_7]
MDKIKEKIAYLKLWLTTSLAFLAGGMSWIFNNINTGNRNVLYYDAVAIIILIGLIQYLGYEIHRIIKNMEE